ncbi:hypothetical protein [Sorangium sp. So ce887]|uniref:hypothetical protein n=1 Tax=Sorangium sp. So ce887 TaxID=3133324 RepID=UPI003F644685
MGKTRIEIEVEQTGPDKWSAWNPITGEIETRPTRWQAVQAVINKIVDSESGTAAVKMHGQGSSST